MNNEYLENALTDLLGSNAASKIYIFLSVKHGAKSEEISKGTSLHPSTVRELLAKLNRNHIIYRKKFNSKSSGKKPYIYYAIPPTKLLHMYSRRMENKLNKIIDTLDNRKKIRVKISLSEVKT